MFYTGKGDKGDTGLYGKKERFSKASLVTEALGSLDECNAYIGLCRAEANQFKSDVDLSETLHNIQKDLFIVQAHIAGADKNIREEKIEKLETLIDDIEKKLPKIDSFSVSGNSMLSAKLDVARTLLRKAERRIVAVSVSEKSAVHENILTYINRLSSVLFALTRYSEHQEGAKRESPTYE